VNGPESAAPGVETPSTPPDAEPVGSVAQEALKLLRAVASAPRDDEAVGTDAGVDDGTRTESPHVCSTTWCPVCQVVGFVRDNPDAIASVTRSATDLARSLRNLVDAALAPEEKKQ
jgi:hypothetical protein